MGNIFPPDDAENSYTPPPDLMRWLESGPAPVFVGFGSMVIRDPERLVEIIETAAKRSGTRVLLQSSWTDMSKKQQKAVDGSGGAAEGGEGAAWETFREHWQRNVRKMVTGDEDQSVKASLNRNVRNVTGNLAGNVRKLVTGKNEVRVRDFISDRLKPPWVLPDKQKQQARNFLSQRLQSVSSHPGGASKDLDDDDDDDWTTVPGPGGFEGSFDAVARSLVHDATAPEAKAEAGGEGSKGGVEGSLGAGAEASAEAEEEKLIFHLGNCPHNWLFPRMAAVVHHGGAGTVAAGLRGIYFAFPPGPVFIFSGSTPALPKPALLLLLCCPC